MTSNVHATLPAKDILKAADEARGNFKGIAWNVTIESTQNERVTDTLTYDIKARGFNISGISMAPPKYRGNKLLMLNTSMWYYKNGLSKPVPISQRQKLMGDASYGDIASTNYADNYEAARLPDEDVNKTKSATSSISRQKATKPLTTRSGTGYPNAAWSA